MAKPEDSAPPPRIDAWFKALVAADTPLLDELLAHDLPVDVEHPLHRRTALMEAVRLGRTPLVSWLLKRGAAPAHLCGTPKGTPLHCAISLKRWAIAELLLASSADISVVDAQGRTPLHLLCVEATEDPFPAEGLAIARQLIDRHCPLDARDPEGIAALHHCVINGQYALTQLLLTSGASPNILIPASKVSPLFIAAIERDTAMATLLIQYGADPLLPTREGATAADFLPIPSHRPNESASPLRLLLPEE